MCPGADRTYSDSLQAVRGHQYHPVLSEPGTADVSCSVDFRSLRRAALALPVPEGASGSAAKPVAVHGPLTQGELLMGLGIEVSKPVVLV
jgi:NADH dehydrogenase [ubiquinone] 1 alpha subcomplex assembly factor 7